MDEGVRLIDLEHMLHYPLGYRPSFRACYDLTGQGLPSPAATNNVGLFSSHIGHAVGAILPLDPDALLDRLMRDVPDAWQRLAALRENVCANVWLFDGNAAQTKCAVRLHEVVARCQVPLNREVVVAGQGCAGVVSRLIRAGCSRVAVHEKDPSDRHVLARYIEGAERTDIRFAGEGDEWRAAAPGRTSRCGLDRGETKCLGRALIEPTREGREAICI